MAAIFASYLVATGMDQWHLPSADVTWLVELGGRVTIEELVKKAPELRLQWLHTLSSFVHYRSQVKAAEELGIDAKTVRSQLRSLEKEFDTILVDMSDGPWFFEDCNTLLIEALPLLEKVRTIAQDSAEVQNDEFVRRAYNLTFRDMYLFTRLLETNSRKKVDVHLPKSQATISRNIRRVKHAMGGGKLLGPGPSVQATEYGKTVYDVFKEVLQRFADVDLIGGEIEEILNESRSVPEKLGSRLRALSDYDVNDTVTKLRIHHVYVIRKIRREIDCVQSSSVKNVPYLEELRKQAARVEGLESLLRNLAIDHSPPQSKANAAERKAIEVGVDALWKSYQRSPLKLLRPGTGL
ncbi:LysR family transcriptional regulator [Sphingomonas sp. RHCKR47]|uniref:helix-turn-helix domain-containing protein n=1 Tax=Sphingomonas citricola TaxID=2862498 RepID=UPI001C67D34B|nr:LysR family transcriptional regulator [Sphingomonas citricola]MBW6524607.1 LysR family transcriptional regulator [Sphingomonas citricola]